jgi:two-component system, chemotaxis family, chemotaxis protein CheY
MLVDDDVATVEVFSEYLKLHNVNIIATAISGDTAVDIYKQYKPDIVFVDVMMPVFDGFYVLENIRKINPNVVIIMITADLSKSTEEKLKMLNATKIIYKPFEIQELLDCINTFTKH